MEYDHIRVYKLHRYRNLFCCAWAGSWSWRLGAKTMKEDWMTAWAEQNVCVVILHVAYFARCPNDKNCSHGKLGWLSIPWGCDSGTYNPGLMNPDQPNREGGYNKHTLPSSHLLHDRVSHPIFFHHFRIQWSNALNQHHRRALGVGSIQTRRGLVRWHSSAQYNKLSRKFTSK